MARGVFDFDTLTPALQRALPTVDAAVDLVFDRYEATFANEMRTGAKWTDRTGNARASLDAKHDKIPMVEHTMTLYGSMPYSIWLEVRWSGKYAIIGPTMISMAGPFSADIAAAVNRAMRSL